MTDKDKPPITDEELQEGLRAGRYDVTPSPSTKAEVLGPQIQRILDLIGIEEAWVSDESCIGDFPVEDTDLARMSQEFGFEVHMDDYVVDVALRLVPMPSEGPQ